MNPEEHEVVQRKSTVHTHNVCLSLKVQTGLLHMLNCHHPYLDICCFENIVVLDQLVSQKPFDHEPLCL